MKKRRKSIGAKNCKDTPDTLYINKPLDIAFQSLLYLRKILGDANSTPKKPCKMGTRF